MLPATYHIQKEAINQYIQKANFEDEKWIEKEDIQDILREVQSRAVSGMVRSDLRDLTCEMRSHAGYEAFPVAKKMGIEVFSAMLYLQHREISGFLDSFILFILMMPMTSGNMSYPRLSHAFAIQKHLFPQHTQMMSRPHNDIPNPNSSQTDSST